MAARTRPVTGLAYQLVLNARTGESVVSSGRSRRLSSRKTLTMENMRSSSIPVTFLCLLIATQMIRTTTTFAFVGTARVVPRPRKWNVATTTHGGRYDLPSKSHTRWTFVERRSRDDSEYQALLDSGYDPTGA